MIDPFIWLTPILVLGIVALLGFVGCQVVLGLSTFTRKPTFDPPAGGYFDSQTVTVSGDPGATIYFTTDGSPPTTSSQGHSSPVQILITTTTTINAFARKDGDQSETSQAQYHIGPIVHTQAPAEKSETSHGSSAVTTLPFANALADGNLIVVWIWYNSASEHVAMVTDTLGNSYQIALGATQSPPTHPGWQQEIWIAPKITGGSGVAVTAFFSGPFDSRKAISAHEYANANSDSPLADPPSAATSAATGTTANASSGSVTTARARLAFGAAWMRNDGSADVAAGFRQRSTLGGKVAEDKDVLVPGSVVEATFQNDAQEWIAQMLMLQ